MKVTIDIPDSALSLVPAELRDEVHMSELILAFFKASLAQVHSVPASVRKNFFRSFRKG